MDGNINIPTSATASNALHIPCTVINTAANTTDTGSTGTSQQQKQKQEQKQPKQEEQRQRQYQEKEQRQQYQQQQRQPQQQKQQKQEQQRTLQKQQQKQQQQEQQQQQVQQKQQKQQYQDCDTSSEKETEHESSDRGLDEDYFEVKGEMFEPRGGSYALCDSVCEECEEEYLDDYSQPVFISPPSCNGGSEDPVYQNNLSSKRSSGSTTPIAYNIQPELFTEGGGGRELTDDGGKGEERNSNGDDSQITFNRYA